MPLDPWAGFPASVHIPLNRMRGVGQAGREHSALPNTHPERTAEEWREKTEGARREARYKFAEDRIKRIVDGMPPLSDEQLAKLAILLRGGEQ